MDGRDAGTTGGAIPFEFRDGRERSRAISALRETAQTRDRQADALQLRTDVTARRRELRRYAREARELADRIEAA